MGVLEKVQTLIFRISMFHLRRQETTFSPRNDANSKKLLWLQEAAVLEATGLPDLRSPVIIADLIGTSFNVNSLL